MSNIGNLKELTSIIDKYKQEYKNDDYLRAMNLLKMEYDEKKVENLYKISYLKVTHKVSLKKVIRVSISKPINEYVFVDEHIEFYKNNILTGRNMAKFKVKDTDLYDTLHCASSTEFINFDSDDEECDFEFKISYPEVYLLSIE